MDAAQSFRNRIRGIFERFDNWKPVEERFLGKEYLEGRLNFAAHLKFPARADKVDRSAGPYGAGELTNDVSVLCVIEVVGGNASQTDCRDQELMLIDCVEFREFPEERVASAVRLFSSMMNRPRSRTARSIAFVLEQTMAPSVDKRFSSRSWNGK